jgi:DNA invertase Pin-like site-specific DNA recombinase
VKGDVYESRNLRQSSTNNQGQDVTMQTRELQKYAEARGWSITSEYLDRGVSGAKDRRPELDRLMTDAKRRKFDAIQKTALLP